MAAPARTLRTRVFLGGQAVSKLGDGLAILAIPLLVLQLTRSPVVAVLASLPGSVGYLAAGLPAGVLADRLDPWQVLIAGDVIRAAIFLALFLLTGSRSAAAWLILALAFAAGAITVFSDTALTIAVRDVFAGARLMTANSWLESASQLGQIIGPGAAGVLAAAGLLHVSMLIDALTFLAALASVLAVRASYPGAKRAAQPQAAQPQAARWRALRRELADGIRYLAATRVLFTLLVFMLVLNLGLGADKLIIFFSRNSLHLPPDQVGLVVTAGGAGGLLGAAGTSLLCRRLGPLPAVTLGAASSGLALLLIAAATSMPVALAGNLLYTFAIVVASVTMRSLRQVLVPRDLLGRVTASWRLGGQGVTLIGAILAGAMTDSLNGDPRPVFAAAGSLTLLTVAVAWFAGLRRERLPASLLAPSAR